MFSVPSAPITVEVEPARIIVEEKEEAVAIEEVEVEPEVVEEKVLFLRLFNSFQ